MNKNIAAIVKDKMTGAELGRLVIMDTIELHENGGDHIFSESDVQAILAKMEQPERRIYKRYWELADVIKNNLYAAGSTSFLQATNGINVIKSAMISKRALDTLREEIGRIMLVTDKEYKDLSEAQRAEKLKEDVTLSHVVLERATYFAKHPDLIPKLWKMYDEYREADEQTKKDDPSKKDYLFGTDLLRSDLFYHFGDTGKESGGMASFYENFEELGNYILNTLRACVKSGRLKIKESLLDEEPEKFHKIRIPREALYKAKLPEQIEYIDKYQPGEDVPFSDPKRIAIMVNPPEEYIDKRGHFDREKYIDRMTSRLEFEEGSIFFETEKGREALQYRASKVEGYLAIGYSSKKIIDAMLDKLNIKIKKDVLSQAIGSFTASLTLYQMITMEEGLKSVEPTADKRLYAELVKRYLLPVQKIDLEKYENIDSPSLKKICEYIRSKNAEDWDTRIILTALREAIYEQEK